MTVKYSMRFKIYTLIDITKTDAHRSDIPKRMNQQANFNTLYNVIGLRTNPTDFIIDVKKDSVNDFKFGSSYKGKHNIWECEFFVEADQSIDVKTMIEDFHLVPIIKGLDETIKIDKGLFFSSKDEAKCNIIFERIDK